MLVVHAADHLVSATSVEHVLGRRVWIQLTTTTLAGDGVRPAGQARRDADIVETAARLGELGDADCLAEPPDVAEFCTCFEGVPAPTQARGQRC